MKKLLVVSFVITMILDLAMVIKFKLFFIPAVFTFAVALATIHRTPRFGRGLGPCVILLAATYFYFGLTAAWADSPTKTIYYTAIDSIWIAVFVVSYVFLLRQSLLSAVKAITVLPIATAIIFAVVLYYYGSLRAEFAPEVGSLGNVSSMLLCGYLPFYLWIRQQCPRNWLFRASGLLTLGLLVLSQSRAGLLIGGGTALATIIVLAKDPFVAARRTIVLLAFSASITSLLRFNEATRSQVDYAFERLLMTDTNLNTPGDEDRKRQYLLGFALSRDNYLMGIGYGDFANRMQDTYGTRVSSHSIYLGIFAETGILGTILFFSLPIWAIAACLKVFRSRNATLQRKEFAKVLILGIVATLAYGLFGQLHQSFIYFNLMAWALALRYHGRREAPSSANALILNSEAWKRRPTLRIP